MVISHLIGDTPSLKASASTCFAWYTVAAPHLHYTLTLRRRVTTATYRGLNPLVALHELGLLPLVKKLQFPDDWHIHSWVVPELFDSWSLRHFSALVNVQELIIMDLDLPRFTLGFESYFGHFSPTLRSIALFDLKRSPLEARGLPQLIPKVGRHQDRSLLSHDQDG